MSIDVSKEEVISFAEAAKMLNVTPRSIWEWATKGIKRADGLTLESVVSGERKRKTSKQAVQRFITRRKELMDDERTKSAAAGSAR